MAAADDLKVVIVGDSGVGKTCLINRFIENQYHGTSKPTVGIDNFEKCFAHDRGQITIQMWDTAGEERYRTITSAYYKPAHGFLLAYDATNKKSFANVTSTWLKQMNTYSANKNYPRVLVACKCDQTEQVVTKEEGKLLADKHGMLFFETSAKNSFGVNEAFDSLATATIDAYYKELEQKADTTPPAAPSTTDSARCCVLL